MGLREQSRDIWTKYNPALNEHGKNILATIIEQKKVAQKNFLSSYYIILVIGGIFYCLNSQLIGEVEIFSVKLTNLYLIKWAISPIFCFFIYKCIIHFVQDISYRDALEEYLQIYVPEITSNFLTEILYSTSFYSFEFYLNNKHKSKSAYLFLLLFVFSVFILPTLILIYIIYINILEWNLISSFAYKVIVSIITLLLLFRIISLILELSRKI